VSTVSEEVQSSGELASADPETRATRTRSERLPVYLETAKELNVALYLKLGSKVVGGSDVSKAGPHFWSMLCEN